MAFISEQDEIQPNLGIAYGVDSAVYAFDGFVQQISKVRWDGRGEFLVGREGQGPGEFSQLRREIIWPVGATADWIAFHADTLLAFDGRRLQRFSSDGAPIDEVAGVTALATGGGPYFVNRLRSRDGEVLLGLERQGNHSKLGRRFDLWSLRPGREAESVLGLELPKMPATSEGGLYRGPEEATPLWDAIDDCVVVTDGASTRVMVGSVASALFDTVHIELPAREAPADVELANVLARTGARGDMPLPSRAKKIRRIVIAPDHWIWIEPVQPLGLTGVEVIRLNPVTRQQRVDTVPAFPTAFGRRGEYWSVLRTPTGAFGLARITMASPQGSAARDGR